MIRRRGFVDRTERLVQSQVRTDRALLDGKLVVPSVLRLKSLARVHGYGPTVPGPG
jgi:hypothetical protein